MGSYTPEDALVTAKRVASIGGISDQRLRYWEKTGLVAPVVHRRVSARNLVRLYSLDGAAEVLVLAQLVDQPGISLQHVRKVLERLRAEGGHSSPLRELRFAVDGREVVFQHPDGTWEGSHKSGQVVEITLRVDLEQIRATLDRARRRSEDQVGVSERRRATLGSTPVFAGTRVPVESVQRFIGAGASDERILEAYPELSPADVDAVRGHTLVQRRA